MTKWLAVVTVSCGVVLGATAAEAQMTVAVPERGYFIASIGRGEYIVWTPGASQFRGPMVGGAAGLCIGRHFFVEGSVDRVNYRRNDTGREWHGQVTALLGRAAYRFGRAGAPVRYFVAGAVGHARDEFQRGAADPRERLEGAQWGLGAGADIKLHSRFFLRPELGILLNSYRPYARAAVGGGVRF